MSEEYILPGELAALIAFVLAPALLLAFAAQAAFFASHGVLRRQYWSQILVAYLLTACGSLVVGVALAQWLPESLGSPLGVRDVHVAGESWPVMPLAFVSVAIVAPIATLWVRNARRA